MSKRWRLEIEEDASRIEITNPKGFIFAHVGQSPDIYKLALKGEQIDFLAHLEQAIPKGTEVAYIGNIEVDRDARHHGLGSALMKRMLRELKARGVIHVYGHTVEYKGRPLDRLLGWLKEFGFELVPTNRWWGNKLVAVTL